MHALHTHTPFDVYPPTEVKPSPLPQPEVVHIGHTLGENGPFSSHLLNFQFQYAYVLYSGAVLDLTCVPEQGLFMTTHTSTNAHIHKCTHIHVHTHIDTHTHLHAGPLWVSIIVPPLFSVDCCILIFSYKSASSSLRRISWVPSMSLSLITCVWQQGWGER